MATDALIHKLSTTHPDAILKLFEIPDGNAYKADSLTFKDIEDRRDIVFEKADGKDAILLEVQGYNDTFLYHRAIRGKAMYCIQKKFTGRIRVVVIFLEPSHYHAATQLSHHFDGSSDLAFQPAVIILNQKELTELEHLNDVRLVPLYPLCKVSPDQIKTAAPQWAKQIRTAVKLSEDVRQNLLALLGGFIIHCIKDLTLEAVNQMFGDFKMEETQVGKELIAIGYRRGHDEGIDEGIEKGIEKGRDWGSLQTQREDLIDLLVAKFNHMEKIWLDQLDTVNNPATLKGIYRAVLQAKSRKQVKAAFDAALGNGNKAN